MFVCVRANAVKQFSLSVISPACFLALYVVSSALQDKQLLS